jgi:ABC-type nitrate/sulfonate/bicarbonate transport system substrate-binding protein
MRMQKSDVGITRRTSVGFLGLALMAGARSSHAALEQTKLDLGGNRDPQLGAQIAIAVLKGYFKDEGLDVTVRWTDTSGDLLPLMAGETINVAGLSMGNIGSLMSRGVPVKAIAALCDYSGTQGLVLRPGLKLAGPKDLAGRKFAAPITSPHEMALGKLGMQYGFQDSTITLVRMQPSEGIVACARGDVDGVLTYQPHLSRIVSMGGTLYFTGHATYFNGTEVVLPVKDRLLNVRSLLVGNTKWMAANPNTTSAILRAVIRGNTFIQENRAEATTLLSSFFKTSPEVMTQALNSNIYGMSIDDGLVDSFAFTSSWLQKIGQLKQPMEPAAALDSSWLRKVDPKLVTVTV